MRYLGNKQKIILEIEELILRKVNVSKKQVFFDAFSGTGAVSDYMKKYFKIIANDSLYTPYIYTSSKLNNSNVTFDVLGINPFEYFNNDNLEYKGFVYKNYSPASTEKRMYFSEENALKIDYIRNKIEKWKKENKINEEEYNYLLASLIESLSKVSNIAGVYGAYLKQWDNRALKKMKFIEVERNKEIPVSNKNKIYNFNIEEIIKNIDCDIIYLDPPYTKNQYATQYHLLETISKNDNPEIVGVTGGRKDSKNNNSNFSKDINAHIAFANLIKYTKAKHIIVSYSSLGLMSKEYIENVLKRYGKKETYELKKINYKKYQNHQTDAKKTNIEYIFYIEKTDNVIYNSPLNYIGGKGDLIEVINKTLPNDVNNAIDLFAGGFNVGINLPYENIIYNDINFKVKELIEMFKNEDTVKLCKNIEKQIKKYNLEPNKKEAYLKLRNDYNKNSGKDILDLYMLILFGFQQQIRFNSKLEYNNPVGQSGYNNKIFEKIISFSSELKNKKIEFYNKNFYEIENMINKDTFVYCDPPYLIALASYNDGKRGFNGWNEKLEIQLLEFLDRLNSKKIKFMLSNILKHKEKENHILLNWLLKNNYNIKIVKTKNREEAIITNY